MSPTSRKRHLVPLIGAVTLLVILVVIGWTSSASKAYLSAIPVPPNAHSVSEMSGLLGLRRTISFELDEEYPSNTARTFYSNWAARAGWRVVPESEDAWSTDRWQSFVDASGQREASVDQWLVRWISTDGRWDLRLALRYERPLTQRTRPIRQTAYLAASRIGI